MRMVASGAGVSLLPKMAINVEVGKGKELKVWDFVDPSPTREIGLV